VVGFDRTRAIFLVREGSTTFAFSRLISIEKLK